MVVLFIGMGKTGFDLAEFYCNHQLNQSADKDHHLVFFDTRDHPPYQTEIESLVQSFQFDLSAQSTRSAKNYSYQKLEPNQLNDHWLIKAEQIYLSPAIEPEKIKMLFNSPESFDHLVEKCHSDLDVFFAHLQGNAKFQFKKPALIAVTGTNGKSSICQFLLELCQAAQLKAKILGNFGDGFLETFNQNQLGNENDCDVYILELSSFQLFYSQAHDFEIAILSNLYPEHLNWHGSFENYSNAKLKIFRHSKYGIYWYDCTNDEPDDLINQSLSCRDDRNLSAISKADLVQFAEIEAFQHLEQTEKINFLLAFEGFKKLKLEKDRLNDKQNLNFKIAKQTLKSHQALHFRNQKITLDRVEWINDSKSTNSHSLIAALNNLYHSELKINHSIIYLWLIIGGNEQDLKGGNFKAVGNWLNQRLKQTKTKELIANIELRNISIYGDAAALIKKDLNIHSQVEIECFDDLKAAIHHCQNQTREFSDQDKNSHPKGSKELKKSKELKESKGLKVLFSPGCASLSQFKNYAHRGEVFNQIISNQPNQPNQLN